MEAKLGQSHQNFDANLLIVPSTLTFRESLYLDQSLSK